MFASKRVLIITREVKFAMNAKAALERLGYEVTTFTNSRPALDFFRQNLQDLVLLDFRVNDMAAPDVIDHMRAMQPDIFVIAAPNHPAVQNLKEKHNIFVIINLPYPLRRLVALIESALKLKRPSQEKRSSSSAKSAEPVQSGISEAIEFWISDSDTGETVLEYTNRDGEKDKPQEVGTHIFQKLAAEEPPMPSFEEGSTIRDLRDHLANPENIRRVLEVFSDDTTEPNRPSREALSEDSRSIPAALLLEATQDDSNPIRSFSATDFMNRVREQGDKIILPLPSWLQESEKYIREPEFLGEDLPSITNSFEYTATKTEPNEAQEQAIEQDPMNLVTDQLEPVKRSHPITTAPIITGDEDEDEGEAAPPPFLPEMPSEPDAEVLDEDEAAQHTADFGDMQSKAVASAAQGAVVFSEYDEADPYIAQLAVTLTQVSLELTAAATLLARDNHIVAYAGNLPPEDIADLRQQVGDDWGANGQKSRIRFITLSGSGEDYMLFTRQTDANFTLSTLFEGTKQLHDIRRQSNRLAEALLAIPELEIVTAPPEAVETTPQAEAAKVMRIRSDEEVGERAPYTFVWMLRHPEAEIPAAVRQALKASLSDDLLQAGWQIHDIQVQADFVYLFAEVPVSLAAQSVIQDLFKSSAAIVGQNVPTLNGMELWDDSYLVLQPGREMTTTEIQRFINFVRG